MITFTEMALNPEIMAAIGDLGFVEPTPIQQRCISHILNSDEDVIATAQTGTGKTAAFGLPVLQKIEIDNKKVQTLILSPTRELCVQIAEDLKNYSKYLKGLNVVAVYGGASAEPQINALKKGCQVVVGTPGRTLDLIKRRKLKISEIRWVILDEADEMLSMGFKDDLDEILATTPQEKQTLLFSATMPKGVGVLARKYMNNPVEIKVSPSNVSTTNVKHEFYMAHARDRYLVLKRIADVNPSIYAIIFCRTRSETKDVAEKLSKDGYNADALHGDLSQAQRDHVMSRFRRKQLQLLVATDVAARGLDVEELSHVINYNLPDENDIYVHRSGRTGRAENKGTSIAIIHTREQNKIRDIEKRIGQKFTQNQIPKGHEICEKQLFHLIDKVEKVEVEESQIETFLPQIYKKLEWLSREDLIKHFVSAEFNRFLSYYKNAKDISVDGRDSNKPKAPRKNRVSFSRFYISVGSKDKMNPRQLINLINDQMPEKNIEIGDIEILKSFSFFEIDSAYKTEVPKAFKDTEFNDVQVKVELSQAKSEYSDSNDEKFAPKRNRKPSRSRSRDNKSDGGDKRSKKDKKSRYKF